ncbi:MAG: hypothetical protein KF878_36510, partial [Planctomycetes bacterium]|nr:hypothetical protein [Planctomycetota bacterium]
LEVACLAALDRREEAAAALARLPAPPPELTWDLRLQGALAAAAAGRWEEAMGALGAQPRPPGPARPRELDLAARVLARLQAVVAERGPTMDALKGPELAALTPMLEVHPRVSPGRPLPDDLAGPVTLLVARSLMFAGLTPAQSTRLLLAISEAWPDHGVAQEDSVGPLYMIRLNHADHLLLDEAGQEPRIAEAARRALGVEHPVRRAMAWTLRLASLVNLERLDEALELVAELPPVLEAAARADRRATVAIGATCDVLRARLALRRGEPDVALGRLEAAERVPEHDPLTLALVRQEALAAMGRDDDSLRILLEAVALPLDRVTWVTRTLHAQAWEGARRRGRWSDAERMLGAAGTIGGHHEDLGLRMAYVLVRQGRTAAASAVLEDHRANLRKRGLEDLVAGVRGGDPRALEQLEALATQP